MAKTFIIAEAGVNHNGSIENALKMVDIAKQAGADAIKFQTFKAKQLVTKHAEKARYQSQYHRNEETQYEMLSKLELDLAAHKLLMESCIKNNIIFMSTPFDLDSIEMLHELGMNIFKVPSGEITNLPYLQKIGELNKKIILSTGMSTIQDIKNALDTLITSGTLKEKICILHANSAYPTPMKDVNLKAMNTINDEFNIEVGYSDHTLGIEVDIAAVALGAVVIEKHFTLDRSMIGPDHKASLEPNELREMVRCIRNVELALGCSVKEPSESEMENMTASRRSIVALRDIEEGEVFTEDNITVKRPGTGLSPMKWYEVLGSKAQRNYEADEII